MKRAFASIPLTALAIFSTRNLVIVLATVVVLAVIAVLAVRWLGAGFVSCSGKERRDLIEAAEALTSWRRR